MANRQCPKRLGISLYNTLINLWTERGWVNACMQLIDTTAGINV